MKIAVIVAMKDELPLHKLEKQIKKTTKILDYEFVEIKNNKKDFVICYSRIGKANAAGATSLLLEKYKPEYIINIGSAGCVDKELNLFDIILVDKYYYTDVDATKFGYKVGQVPQEKEYYQFDKKLNTQIKKALKEYKLNLKNVGTSDSFVTLENHQGYQNLDQVSCVDMEATSIAQVVSKTNTKLISIKFIVDSIYKKIESKEQWDQDLFKIQNSLIDMVTKIIEEIYETNK